MLSENKEYKMTYKDLLYICNHGLLHNTLPHYSISKKSEIPHIFIDSDFFILVDDLLWYIYTIILKFKHEDNVNQYTIEYKKHISKVITKWVHSQLSERSMEDFFYIKSSEESITEYKLIYDELLEIKSKLNRVNNMILKKSDNYSNNLLTTGEVSIISNLSTYITNLTNSTQEKFTAINEWCKTNKDKCVCARRSFAPVNDKYQMDAIWIIWDVILQQGNINNNPMITKILEALLKIFSIKIIN